MNRDSSFYIINSLTPTIKFLNLSELLINLYIKIYNNQINFKYHFIFMVKILVFQHSLSKRVCFSSVSFLNRTLFVYLLLILSSS